MIKVYYLEVEIIDGTHTVAGIDLIHDAILEATEYPHIRKLIMDASAEEEQELTALAIGNRDPTQAEIEQFNSIEPTPPPTEDEIRAGMLLETSPPVITVPEMWELLRIIGRRLGYIK